MNCFTYALGRFRREGGYVVYLKSPRWWGPHFLYSRDLITFYEFVPKYPRRRILPPWRFDGYVKEWQARKRQRRERARQAGTDRRQS